MRVAFKYRSYGVRMRLQFLKYEKRGSYDNDIICIKYHNYNFYEIMLTMKSILFLGYYV